MVVDTVSAARINCTIFTSNIGPLAICSEDELYSHTRDTTDPERHCVNSLFIHALLMDIN
jgi:hypothetical protein